MEAVRQYLRKPIFYIMRDMYLFFFSQVQIMEAVRQYLRKPIFYIMRDMYLVFQSSTDHGSCSAIFTEARLLYNERPVSFYFSQVQQYLWKLIFYIMRDMYLFLSV